MNIVQAVCPHCKNQLRIPADWLERPMRCKHCKNVFQAKSKPEPVAVGFAPPPKPEPAKQPEPVAPAPQPAAWTPPAPNPAIQAPYYPTPAQPNMPYPPQQPYPYPPQPYPQQPYPPQPYAPYPPQPAHHAPSFGFDDHHSSQGSQADALVAKPNRAAKSGGNNLLIGGLVVGFLFVATAAVLMAVLPQLTRDREPAPVVKVDPKKKAQIEFIKSQVKKINAGVIRDKDSGKETPVAAVTPRPTGVMPRRALFISPENYLMHNSTLYYHESQMGGMNDALYNPLVDRLSKGAPFDISPGQVYVLTDSDIAGQKTYPPQKVVIEGAIKEFCESSRAQDRVLIFWSGHACEIEGKGYIIPLEGDKDVKETCIPLSWVFEQMSKSKARQKVLVLDAFRFPPGRGLALPATGAMTEAFEKEIQSPPAGIQVWTACGKDQQSIEFESGSLFQQALKETLKEMSAGTIVQSKDPFPLEAMVAKVNAYMKEKLVKDSSGKTMEKKDDAEKKDEKAEPKDDKAKDGKVEKKDEKAKEDKKDEKKDEKADAKEEKKMDKKEMAAEDSPQVSRLYGKEATGGTEPNPLEPIAKAVVWVDLDKSGAVSKKLEEILTEIRQFGARKRDEQQQVNQMKGSSLPALPPEKLDDFKDEGFNPFTQDSKDLKKMKEKYPMRVAAFEVSSKLKETMEIRMKEFFPNPGGALDTKRKAQFLNEQKEPAEAIFELEELLDDMKKLKENRETEASKRWQAHFDLAEARLMARLIYIYEYNNLIAAIRSDALPALEDFHSGWRVNTSNKVQIKEGKVKDLAKNVVKSWDRIAKEYPSTPWAIIAKRERNVSLGLQWVPTRD